MKKVKLVALALVASISFAACGSDSASTDTTAAAETETTVAGAVAGDIVEPIGHVVDGAPRREHAWTRVVPALPGTAIERGSA